VPHFRTAVDLVRGGAIGKLRMVSVILPFWTTRGGPFATRPVPAELDWDLYQGQAPLSDYCPERTHFTYRWFFEYAGGIITDWGQHHMDIAHWGMNMERSGPLTVEGKAYFPNAGRAECGQCFNNPDRFVVKMTYPGDIDLWYFVARDEKYLAEMGALTPEQEADLFAGLPEELKAEQRNGILFVGDKGRIFVNRGAAYGKAVEEHYASHPEPEAPGFDDTLEHMRDFFDCVKSRQRPITDVEVAHRTITACHLGNIAMRLKRKITWDAAAEQIVGDDEANARQSREQRAPYVIEG
jgi:predicted dehydrogenase